MENSGIKLVAHYHKIGGRCSTSVLVETIQQNLRFDMSLEAENDSIRCIFL